MGLGACVEETISVRRTAVGKEEKVYAKCNLRSTEIQNHGTKLYIAHSFASHNDLVYNDMIASVKTCAHMSHCGRHKEKRGEGRESSDRKKEKEGGGKEKEGGGKEKGRGGEEKEDVE